MKETAISKLELKRLNRMQILRLVREKGPISRVDISKRLCITRAAITIITTEMIEQGILTEVGGVPSKEEEVATRGRRKIMLDIAPDSRFIIGVYADKKTLRLGLTTLHYQIMEQITLPMLDAFDINDFSTMISVNVKKLLKNSCLSINDIAGVGIGIMSELKNFLGGSKDEYGILRYNRLEQDLHKMLNLPIACGDALLFRALSCPNYVVPHVSVRNHAMLHLTEDGEILSYLMANDYPEYVTRGDNQFVQNMVLGNGTKVKDLFSKESVQKNLGQYFSASATPNLFEAAKGDINSVTLPMVFACANKDEVITGYAVSLLQDLTILLSNILFVSGTGDVTLSNFGLNETQLSFIHDGLLNMGCLAADGVVSAPAVPEEKNFLYGCHYASQKFFYYEGGIQIKED